MINHSKNKKDPSIIDQKHDESKKALDTTFSLLAEVEVEQNPPQSKLISPEMKKKQLAEMMKESFSKFEWRLKKAVLCLEENPRFKEFYPSREKFEEILTKTPPEDLASKRPLSHLLGISDEGLLEIYGIGLEYYDRKDFENALNIFFLLNMLFPFFAKFWMALGASCEQLQQNEEAINSYIMAYENEDGEILAAVDVARCLKKMNNLDAAKEMVQEAIKKAKEDPKYSESLEQLQEALTAFS